MLFSNGLKRIFASPSRHQLWTRRLTSIAPIYHAGLRQTAFTASLDISSESQLIPIFRILNPDGSIEPGWNCPFTSSELLDIYKFIINVSVYDSILYDIQRQGRISFYIQNQGEETLQAGIGAAIKVDDHVWCQYRELGVLMWRGFTLSNVLDQCLSNKDDEGKGRQMPISYSRKDLNIQTISTPLTSQIPQAAGAGYAFKLAREDRCSIGFFGEGAASEGDFHAAMNFASVLKAQTIFVCRNNGYAISTPVQDQYAGDGIAIRGLAYGMHTVRVDGNDLFATYLAMKKCREICVEQSTPVCIELMTYRQGHHSTSDDSSQYRPEGEMNSWLQPGVSAIDRVKTYLIQNGLWTEEQDKEELASAKKIMLEALKECQKKKAYAIIPGIFDDVYAEPHWHIEEQAKEARAFLNANKKLYADIISKHDSIG